MDLPSHSGLYRILDTDEKQGVQPCYAANREQPQIENSNEMHDIHCAISVFMTEVQTTLAGTMNTCKALAGAMNNIVYTCGAADDLHALHNKCTQEFCDNSVQYLDPHTTKDHL